jgi:hypothetical protein
MSMLQKILAKLDSQPDGGSRVTPQHSFRRGLTEDGGPRSADVIRLEHANHNLQRQVYEMERSHTHELDVARSVHAASVSRIAHELFDSVEKFVTHLRLLMTLDATASRAKSELFFNAVAAYLHAVAHKAHTPSRALPKLGSPRRDGANESAATGVDDGDNLLRDGQEVMKLLRMTIRETRAAMSTKDNRPADKK